MVFKHSKMPCDQEDSFQLAFQHVRQVNCSGQSAFSGQKHIPENQRFPDGAGLGDNFESEKIDAVASDHNSRCALNNTSGLSLALGSNGDTTKSESNIKRPFGDNEEFQFAAKRTRQMDRNVPAVSSTCEGFFTAFMADEESNSRKDDAIPEVDSDSYGSNFSFPWFTCRTSEDTRLESPVRVSFYPGYYEDPWRSAGHNRGQEYRSSVFSCLPRKPVAIGPDHQADVPMWRSKSFRSCHQGDDPDASASGAHVLTDEVNCEKPSGYCVMPMPDSSSVEEPFRCFKTGCHCLDEGSIRCVRQHVVEARDELRSSLGHERFVELGFLDMGEDAASRWTKEEERLFNDIVVSNPASSGKNYWDDLSLAFPTRSSKELVSYYFNVFMLRKRAEQNRCDPLNVDSDNDEWHYSDDGEFETTEEDEDDSGVESPADAAAEDGRVHGDGEEDIHQGDEDYCEGEEYDFSDGLLNDGKSKAGPHVRPSCINSHSCSGEDQDVHDDSCTSYDGQHNEVEASVGGVDVLDRLRDSLGKEADHGDLHTYYASLSGMTDHDFVVGHCDPKPWEMAYFCGSDKEVDFLPTCNVIEEVFGNESREKGREDQGAS